MTSRERLIEAVNRLGLPVSEFIVGGSGSMVLHGMDRELGDLDIFCTTELWFDLMRQDAAHYNGRDDKFYVKTPKSHTHERFDPPILRKWMDDLDHLCIDVFFAWKIRDKIDPLNLERMFKEHRVMIEGIPTLDLLAIYKIKMPLQDAKHWDDRAAIDDWLIDRPEYFDYLRQQRRSFPSLVPKLPSESVPIPR